VKRAISPVIATVIIVAVTIAIAIAVALWMSGLVGSFTATENIQIISAYATGSQGNWIIYLTVKNVGTTDATIDNIFINGKPASSISGSLGWINATLGVGSISSYTGGAGGNLTSINIPLKAGNSATITIEIKTGFTSGQMVEVKLHTASGKEYPKQVTLP